MSVADHDAGVFQAIVAGAGFHRKARHRRQRAAADDEIVGAAGEPHAGSGAAAAADVAIGGDFDVARHRRGRRFARTRRRIDARRNDRAIDIEGDCPGGSAASPSGVAASATIASRQRVHRGPAAADALRDKADRIGAQ